MIMSRVLMSGMIERGAGHIVFVSSLAGKAASPRASIYNGTKFGLRGFALALREDLAGEGTGVGVSVVLPGFVRDAGMFADSGANAPPGVGTATPGAGRAPASCGRSRRTAARSPLRRFSMRVDGPLRAPVSPGVAGRAQRGGGTRTAERLARGQTDKR